MFKVSSLIIIFIITYCVSRSGETSYVTINVNNVVGKFEHFWKSTGFCPPDPKQKIYKFMLSEEEMLNIALIGSLPHLGIKQIRIHWLLNLIIKEQVNNEVSYNFTILDKFLNHMKHYNLKPGFEIMGIPIANQNSTYQTIYNEKYWSDIVQQIAEHYIDKFGAKEVSEWRFETWNEPDLKTYNLLKFTLAEYLQYVVGSAEGLELAFKNKSKNGSAARFGGPAGLFRDKEHHPLCWGLLRACSNTSLETRRRCPIQFISFHRKGDGTTEGILNGTLQLLDLLHKNLPNLKKLPIANDESDIMVGWSRSMEWRADVRYAAMVVKVISDYYKSVSLDRKLKIEVLSNDNGFLNYHPYYFTQRTLFARFQMNHTNPPHQQFIKKPVYSVMALLSLLGDEYLKEEITPGDPLLTVLSTRMYRVNHSFVAILLTYANNSHIDIEDLKTVNVKIGNFTNNSNKFVIYGLDNVYTVPYYVWLQANAPVFPNKHVRKQMRAVEEPIRLVGPSDVNGSSLIVKLNLTMPSVVLIQICSKNLNHPGQVKQLTLINITWNEVLLTWSDKKINQRCIRTYEVEFKSKCANSLEFKRVNINDTVFLSYHHEATVNNDCEGTRGWYRVRVVDFWDRRGKYSKIKKYL